MKSSRSLIQVLTFILLPLPPTQPMDFTFTSTPSTTAGDTPVARPSQVFTFGTHHHSQVHSLPPNQRIGEASVPFTPPNLASPGPSQQQLQQPPQQHLYSQSIFSPQVGHTQQHANDIESRQLNPGGRMTLKQERGVGDSKRWRNRLWNQIENRIKDTRVSRQNARRQGLFLDESSSANNIPGENNGGIIGGCRSSGSEGDSLPQLSEEEEQRIIAEEWEKFKAEHAATLWAELQGLSDVEIEEFEQEMLQQRGEYNPSYDMLLQQEEDEMQSAIEEYLRSQSLSSANNTSISIPMATSNTSSIEDQVVMLLVGQACFRCLGAPFQLSSAADQNQHLHINTQQERTSQPSMSPQVICHKCHYHLNGDALRYIANVAQSHSQNCVGSLAFSFDDDTGLLIACNTCDLLA